MNGERYSSEGSDEWREAKQESELLAVLIDLALSHIQKLSSVVGNELRANVILL